MSQNDRPKCSTCVHYYQDPVESDEGTCRRRSPELLLTNGQLPKWFVPRYRWPAVRPIWSCSEHVDNHQNVEAALDGDNAGNLARIADAIEEVGGLLKAIEQNTRP